MFDMLTQKWKMGPCLASVFITCFGGYIWDCANAVNEFCLLGSIFFIFYVILSLINYLENFSADIVLGSKRFSNVSECLDFRKNSKDRQRMVSLLRKVAEFGFASIKNESDSRAKFGNQYNVLGVVDPRAVIIGVPREIRVGVRSGVVPSSQSMRLIIASELYPKLPEHE